MRRSDSSKGSILALSLATALFLSGLHSPAEAATSVTLDGPIHFMASDGSDVVAGPGTYQVEASASQLSLTAEGRPPLKIDAKPTTHSETIQTPLAVMVPVEDPDVLHVVLLLPNGQALDAPGSLSGTRPRASGFAVATSTQIQIAAMQVPQSPVRRDHRGEPQQMPVPSSPPSPGFGVTKTPTSALARFRILELQAMPRKFLKGESTITGFILVYQCEVEGQPCSARQDLIDVTWTIDGTWRFPNQILYGAANSTCIPALKEKYPRAGCLYGALSKTTAAQHGGKLNTFLGRLFRVGLTASAVSGSLDQEFKVEMDMPRPYLSIGRPQIVDHR